MGASTSVNTKKNENNIRSEVINSSLTTNSTFCDPKATNTNEIVINDAVLKGDINIDANLKNVSEINVKCSMQNDEKTNNLVDNIQSLMDQQLVNAQTGIGISTAVAYSDIKSDIYNKTINQNELNNILNCAATTPNKNVINISEIEANNLNLKATLENNSKIIADCSSKSDLVRESATKNDTVAQSFTDAKSKGYDIFGTTGITAIIFFIFFVIFIIVYYKTKPKNTISSSQFGKNKFIKSMRSMRFGSENNNENENENPYYYVMIIFCVLFFVLLIVSIIIYYFFIYLDLSPFGNNSYKWKYEDIKSYATCKLPNGDECFFPTVTYNEKNEPIVSDKNCKCEFKNFYPKCYLNNGEVDKYAIFSNDGTRYRCLDVDSVNRMNNGKLKCSEDYSDCADDAKIDSPCKNTGVCKDSYADFDKKCSGTNKSCNENSECSNNEYCTNSLYLSSIKWNKDDIYECYTRPDNNTKDTCSLVKKTN